MSVHPAHRPSARLDRMRGKAKELGIRVLAVAILLAALYLLFKAVVGVVMTVVWVALIAVALVAVVWAVAKLW